MTKWPPFYRRQMHFPEWKSMNFSVKISLKFVLKGPINNIPALVQIMAWHRPGDKPLSEPMLFMLTHICVTWPQWVKSRPDCIIISYPIEIIWLWILKNMFHLKIYIMVLWALYFGHRALLLLALWLIELFWPFTCELLIRLIWYLVDALIMNFPVSQSYISCPHIHALMPIISRNFIIEEYKIMMLFMASLISYFRISFKSLQS